ncbi:hypothetical protein WA026_020674 [Henosepilachna vigintioctopunctata]|uniref:Uncharacterized protein n=1 Tax=Henosepilachna vigintioctopunctata TaxID=420089 RepID=A0AAW1UBJ5_9CUCU
MTQSKQDEYLGQGKNTPENIENENILLIEEQDIIKTISETRDFLLAENENYDRMIYVKKHSAPLDSDSKIIRDEIDPKKITLSTVKRDGNEIIPQPKHNEHLSQNKYTSDVIDNEDILPKEEKQFFKTISETKDFLLAENEHYDGMTFIKENLTPVDPDLNTISIKFSPQMSTSKEKQDVKRIVTQSKQDEYLTQDKDTPEKIMNENISPNQEKLIIETISESRDFLSVENEYYDGMTYVKKYSGPFDSDLGTISPDRITFSQSTEKRDENKITPQSKHDKHLSQDESTSDNIENKESFETISKTRDFLLVENELYDGMTHVKEISSSIDSNLKTINDELIPHMTSTQSTTKRGGNGIMIQSKHDEYLTRGNIQNDNISPKEEQHGFKIISKTRDFLLAENQCYDGMTDIKKKSTPLDPNVETISKEFTSHMSTLSQSLETRDENKIIHQSQHDPHLSQEEHTCYIGNENIPPTKEQPIGRTISITRDFLSAENEFYDGTTYTKKIRAPVDVDLRVISEKLSPRMIISSQSSEKRDAKEITSQSEYTEQVTRDKNISDNIEFDNIVASKQQPIGETISKTREFLLAENNFYDGTTNKKKNLTPVHSHLKTISDQCIENRISVQHEFPEKNMDNIDVREQSQGTHDANSDLGMNSLAFKLASKDDDEDSKSSTFHAQNPILSTNEFLHLEKYSYDSEVCQPPNDKKNNLNLSDNTHIGKSEKISDISNESITLKKSLPSKETSEYRKSTDDIEDDISEDRLTQISPQRMIQSTTNFLSTEIMKYHDAKRKIHDLKSIKDSSNDTNTEIIKRDGDIDQSNKIPEKKTKGFLNIFSKKTKPKIEKRDDDKLIRTSDFVDVTATDEFLNTEKFFYHDGNRHITNKDEPKVIEATSSVTSSDISKTQTSSNKDKSSRPRGIFKIFSRKSEEKDLNMSNQARIDLYDENKSTAMKNKHDNRKEDEVPVDIRTFLHVLKANTFYQNCENISQVTDVFLKTERNLYNDTDRSKSSYEASKELREKSYESEESENQSLKKQNSEKPPKKRNYLKIFHRKSEDEKHFSKHVNDVESHKSQKSEEDKFEVDQQSEQRERFNIFGKKFRHKEKKYVRTEIDNNIDDHKDNLNLMQITNDFLHTERDNYEDVLPITRIDYHNSQLNGKSLRQEQKPLAHMKSSELKAENISEQDRTSRFGSQNSESISPKELDSDLNKLNSTRSEVDESPNKLQQKKSGEKKKLRISGEKRKKERVREFSIYFPVGVNLKREMTIPKISKTRSCHLTMCRFAECFWKKRLRCM